MPPDDFTTKDAEPFELAVRTPDQLPAVVEGEGEKKPESPALPENLPHEHGTKFFRRLYSRQLSEVVRGAVYVDIVREVQSALVVVALLRAHLESSQKPNFDKIRSSVQRLQNIVRRASSSANYILGQVSPKFDEAVEPSVEMLNRERASVSQLNLYELLEKRATFKSAAHDVNNMLTPSFAFASMLEVVPAEKMPDILNKIEKSLLKADRILSRNLVAAEQRNQACSNIASEIQGLGHELPSDCTLTVDNHLPSHLEGELNMDETHFGRLLFNLADNAYKAGARKMRIKVNIQDNKLVIHFIDNGPGFKGKKPLEASQESRSKSLRNGNGNAICLDFCVKAGGDLKLLSTVRDEVQDIGAEFVATLPLKKTVDPR